MATDTEKINAGALFVEVAIEADKADQAFVKLKKKSERAGTESEAAFRRQWANHGQKLAQQLAKDGAGAGKKLAATLKAEYQAEIAKGKALRFEGKIDDATMRAQGKEAAQKFNASLLGGLKELKASGAIDTSEFNQLSRQLKVAGLTSGKNLGQGVQQGAQTSLRGFSAWFKGFVLLELTQVLARVTGAVTQKMRESVGAAEERIRSNTRLAASAKLAGLAEEELSRTAAETKKEYRLTVAVANELTTEATKLAAAAGMAAQSQELLNRALDLGAARGADAARTAVALAQAFRGEDMGTDLLLGMNPSQIWEEYAVSLGKAAGQLTNVEKHQAVVNAIMAAGAVVQGSYREQIEGQLGGLTRWRQMQADISDKLGSAMLPLLTKLGEVLEGPITRGADTMMRWLDRIDRMTNSPLENLVKDLRAAGIESEKLIAAEATLARIQLRAERTRVGRSRSTISVDPDVRDLRLSGQPFTEQVPVPGGMPISGPALSFARATKEAIERDLEIVRAELEKVAAGAAQLGFQTPAGERRAEALASYIEQLNVILANKEREAELTEQVTLAEQTLEDFRNGKLTTDTPSAPAAAAAPVAMGLTSSELDAIKEQVKGIHAEMVSTIASLTATAVDDALLALDRLEQEARETFRKLGQDIPKELVDGFAQRRESIAAAGELESFSRELAALSEVPASEGANAAIRAHIDLVSAYIVEHDHANGVLAEGTDLRERFNAELDRSRAQLAANEQAIRSEAEEGAKAAAEAEERLERGREERLRGLRDQARSLEENARAGIQVAESLGLIGSEAAAALQNVAQLAGAIARIAGGDMTAIPSAIGAFASLIGSLAGQGKEAEQQRLAEQKELLDQLESNRQALERNTAAMGAGQTAGEITAGAGASSTARKILEDYGNRTSNGTLVITPEAVAKLLGDPQGRRRLQEVSDATGVDLVQTGDAAVKSRDYRAFWDAWNTANEILKQSAEHFGAIADSNLAGQMERFRMEVDLLDLDTPAEQLEHFLKMLNQVGAGSFASQIEELVKGGDIAGARDLVKEIFGQMVAGQLTAAQANALFGDVSPDDIRRILGDINGWLEQVEAGGGGVTAGGDGSTRLSVNMTEIQASQLLVLDLSGVSSHLPAGGLNHVHVPGVSY